MTRFTVHDRSGGTLVVSLDGAELFDYVYRSPVARLESPRPYFHPLRTLAGATVTQSRPADHVWHQGLSWALPNVEVDGGGSHNFWGGPTYVRGEGYRQLPNNGTVEHRGFTALEATDGGVEVEQMLQWRGSDGAMVFTEKRRLLVTASADAWSLGFTTVMRNTTGLGIRLGSPSTEGRDNAGYGGLFWRGPAAMQNGEVHGAGTGGSGIGDSGGMGDRGAWMAYSADAATVVMTDHETNPRHPTPWFVRAEEYAGLCPAPFFAEELAVAPGGTVRFGYTVVIADGPSDSGRASALAGRPDSQKEAQ
jgi:hypothetical protein